MRVRRSAVLCVLTMSLWASRAHAGPILLTGHDPDFHSQSSTGAQNFLSVSLDYVMGGTLNDDSHKLLWIESHLSPDSSHLVGANGLLTIGLTPGQDFDVVDAGALATVDFSNYKAIGVASTFGGMLTSAELNALIARSSDIAAFINAGGGLFASAECDPGFSNCDASNVASPHGALYGYLPVAVSGVSTEVPYTLTSFGATLGFSADGASYINECCTHNSFGAVGGLNIVDTDRNGHATTLAGVVSVDDGGFTPVPEPGTLVLFGTGLACAFGRRRRQSRGQ